jgi:acyl phosphate:glycerol-3-phosphate acyltransferase
MDLTEIIKYSGLVIGAYMLGSVPFGLILTKRFSSVDIRREGSGNIGATNVRRVAGAKLGALTLAGDMLKGIVPVYLAGIITGCETGFAGLYVSIVAFAAFLGHLYPVFLKFKDGGKGVATAAGSFLILSPWAFLSAVIVFAAVVYIWRRVSAASLAASAVLPVVVWFVGHSVFHTSCAAVITILIFSRHRENINRLISCTEPEI